jgi:deoxyribodipyrimidine photo-lyase
MTSGLFLHTRDLRIHDNTSLIDAFESCEYVVCVFIFTKDQIDNNPHISYPAVKFMCESLNYLSQSLEKRGIELFIFHGDTQDIIDKLFTNYNFHKFFINKDYTKYAKNRENMLKELCTKHNVQFNSNDDHLLTDGEVLKSDHTIYVKFSPFYNKCMEEFKKEQPEVSTFVLENQTNKYMKFYSEKRDKILNGLQTISVENLKQFYKDKLDPDYVAHVKGGRSKAMDILKNISTYNNYGDIRDIPSESTTNLSAYLKFGCVSIRELYEALHKVHNHELIRSLIWRDFYMLYMREYPHCIDQNVNKNIEIKWIGTDEHFKAWCEGKTGYLLVDAGMRQLNRSGFILNRVRMVTADFLTKILHVSWVKGSQYYAKRLIDYDPSNNSCNWVYYMGTSHYSDRYSVIFNPYNQTKKFDPECKYIKKYIPELANVPNKHLLAWDKHHSEYKDLHVGPIVDYEKERKVALTLFKQKK